MLSVTDTNGKYNRTLSEGATVNESLKLIGKLIHEIGTAGDFPTTLSVSGDMFTASYSLMKRGSYKTDDGEEHPSLCISEKKFRILDACDEPKASDFSKMYLTCIHKNSNNYKFYQFEPLENTGMINASYGRIGNENQARHLKNPFPARQFWIKYYEKLSKGYVDRSSVLKTQKTEISSGTKTNTVREQLISRLYGYAETYAQNTLTDTGFVTKQSVKESIVYFNRMAKCKTVKAFNRNLEHLLALNPRKVNGTLNRGIKRLYADSTDDFGRIVSREEYLLNSMKAMVLMKNSDPKQCDIEIYEATPEQKDEVMEHISNSMKSQVVRIYRVISKTHKKRFEKYLKQNNISRIRQLWHGSRNCNWFSIMNEGLSLTPNAVITGKMFGNGIYFAEKSVKSVNYTSLRGSYWSNRQDNTGFLGLYATAYGNPYETRNYGEKCSKAELEKMNCDCLHARKEKTGLREDEIVVYDENSVLLNYIVELAL